MKIGIVTDIHEAISPLERALVALSSLGADRIVSLGDACDLYGPDSRAPSVVRLLREAGAVGVWGNHDVGLCYQVPPQVRQGADPRVLEYMAAMRPWLVLGGCRFSHNEPWLDATRIEDLWWYDGVPDTPEKAARSFRAVPERYLFVGHFHCWRATTPEGTIILDGDRPIRLDGARRCLVVVAPVTLGWCALFDTADATLTPIRSGG